MKFKNKTTKWFPYQELGSYYRLNDGYLEFYPMNKDGSKNNDETGGGEVDFELLEGELLESGKILTERLEEIGNELLLK